MPLTIEHHAVMFALLAKHAIDCLLYTSDAADE